jgi:hypothetical protein
MEVFVARKQFVDNRYRRKLVLIKWSFEIRIGVNGWTNLSYILAYTSLVG